MKLVPYKARALTRYAPYVLKTHPVYRGAAKAFDTYQAVKPYLPGLMKFQRKMRRRFSRKRKATALKRTRHKRRAVRYVGERVGTSAAKRREYLSPAGGFNSTFTSTDLFSHRLFDLPKSGTTENSNTRTSDIVNFRGVKICMHIKNTQPSEELYVNWAIVTPKNASQTTMTESDQVFRGTGTVRGVTYTSVQGDWQKLHCLPLNTDLFLVHSHKRMKLGPYAGNAGNATRDFEKYIKINRQLRFDGSTATPEGGSMFMIFWCSNSNNNLNAPVGEYKWTTTSYFREAKGR